MTTSRGKDIDPHSMSEKIMQLYIKGVKPKEISRILNMGRGSVRQLIWKRKHKTKRMICNGE